MFFSTDFITAAAMSAEADPLSALSYRELQQRCKSAGLSAAGKKAVLLARLRSSGKRALSPGPSSGPSRKKPAPARSSSSSSAGGAVDPAASSSSDASVTVRLISFREIHPGWSEEDYADTETELGWQGDYDTIEHVRAGVFSSDGDTKIGEFKMVFVHRYTEAFLDACDSDSRELYELGTTFFNSSGSTTQPDLARREREHLLAVHDCDPSILYISEWKPSGYDHPWPGQLPGPADREQLSMAVANALQALLCNPPFAKKWVLAMYIPDGRAAGTAYDNEKKIPKFSPMAPEIAAERSARVKAYMEYDAVGFLSAGFQQITAREIVESHHCAHLFATPQMLQRPVQPYSAASAVALVRRTPRPPKPSGVNKEMLDHLVTQFSNGLTSTSPHLQRLSDEIDAFVARGGVVSQTPLAHCAVANRASREMLTMLMSKGADLNLLDEEGWTALMVAAAGVPGKCSRFTPPNYYWIKMLLDLGADKLVRTPDGATALGLYWKVKRDTDLFQQTILGSTTRGQSQSRQKAEFVVDRAVEALLSVTGPDGNSLVPSETDLSYKPDTCYSSFFEDNALEERAERLLALVYYQHGGLAAAKEAHPAWPSLAILEDFFQNKELCDQMLDRKNNSMFTTLSTWANSNDPANRAKLNGPALGRFWQIIETIWSIKK